MRRICILTGIAIFTIGLGIGLSAAINLTTNPTTNNLIEKWWTYLENFALSVSIMATGGAITLIAWMKKGD